MAGAAPTQTRYLAHVYDCEGIDFVKRYGYDDEQILSEDDRVKLSSLFVLAFNES